MRAASDQRRISGNSWDEVWGPFQAAVSALRLTHTLGGDKLRPGHVINALVLRFLRLPDEEQAAEMSRWLAELELLISDSPEERAVASETLIRLGHKPDAVLRVRDVTATDGPKARPPKKGPKKSRK